MRSGQAVRVAVDIGGTFTDVVLEEGPKRTISKVLTTSERPEAGFLAGVRLALEKGQVRPDQVDLIVHGTTLATNALIERKGTKVGLICTRGFRDTLEMAYEHRFEQSDVFMRRPTPLVPRWLRLEVTERVAADGEVLLPLNEDDVRAAARRFRDEQVGAVAVALMHSYIAPEHEQRIEAILRESLPDVPVSISSEVCPEIREYDRTSTTVAIAYVRPRMHRYLERVEQGLAQDGFACPMLMMMSSGTVTTVEIARRFPIRLVESGPAGGAVLATYIAQQCGHDEVLSFDMGGTTAKLCFIDNFAPQLSRTFEVAREYRFSKGSGIPVKIPVIEMVEIGAGGGSIGQVNALGVIAVGPESAGSEPGPACYGRGGADPTVTDADLVLGKIDVASFAGGKVALDRGASEQALKAGLGQRLGMDAVRAASGIAEIVDENMANATRIHGAESGKDVSARTMIAFGGAAPLHAARLAEKLGIHKVVVPTGAGVGSAIGFLKAGIAYELVKTQYLDMRNYDAAAINAMFREMRQYAEEIVRQAEPDAGLVEKRTAFMRYRGQGHEIAVDLPVRPYAAGDDAQIAELFRQKYLQLFNRTIPGLTQEVVSWSLSLGAGVVAPRRIDGTNSADAARYVDGSGPRSIYDARQGRFSSFGVHRRDALVPGDRIQGPAVIIEDETTTVVSASFDACINSVGYIVLTRKR
jgi:N-methylhydantoinase A